MYLLSGCWFYLHLFVFCNLYVTIAAYATTKENLKVEDKGTMFGKKSNAFLNSKSVSDSTDLPNQLWLSVRKFIIYHNQKYILIQNALTVWVSLYHLQELVLNHFFITFVIAMVIIKVMNPNQSHMNIINEGSSKTMVFSTDSVVLHQIWCSFIQKKSIIISMIHDMMNRHVLVDVKESAKMRETLSSVHL